MSLFSRTPADKTKPDRIKPASAAKLSADLVTPVIKVKSRGSIRRRLLLPLVGLIVGLVITHTSVELWLQKRFLTSELTKRVDLMRSNLIERSQTLANLVHPQVENDMAAFNFSRIDEVLTKAIEESALLEYAILMNSESVVFFHSQRPEQQAFLHGDAAKFALSQTQAISQEYPQINIIENILPIQLGIKQWGILRLGFTTEELQKEIARSNQEITHQTGNMILTTALIALIFIAIASTLVLLIANKLAQPLIQLTLFAKQLAKGNFDSIDTAGLRSQSIQLPAKSEGELGLLANTFVEMASQIRQSQLALEEYNRTLEEKVQDRTQELEQANLKLKELDQLKTNFLSTVSHELRTPLTSVLGFARIIQKKFESDLVPVLQQNPDKKVERSVRQIISNTGIIVEEGERLTNLINDVLDLAKMEAGRTDWNMQPIIIEDIIERAMSATTALFESKPVELHKQFSSNLPLIDGDRDRLIQVVINLISNAIKFTEQGSVTCKTQLNDKSIVVSVTDTGCGIKPEDQALVFEKFKQVGDTLTDKPKGTGLGLPICKEIIEYHGGKVWVESSMGVGSSFYFSLPLPSHSSELLSISEPYPLSFVQQTSYQNLNSQLQLLSTQQADTTKTSKQVMIIDDDPNIRQLVEQELLHEGYQVITASSGIEALQIINHQLPDLAILDVCMPHLNGFAVAAQLRANPSTINLPIVMHTVAEDKRMGQLLSINRYLTKPSADKELIQAVNQLFANLSSDNSKKLLVWDPEQNRRQQLMENLAKAGFTPDQADSPDSCIALVKQSSYDLIIAPASETNHQLLQRISSLQNPARPFFLLLD